MTLPCRCGKPSHPLYDGRCEDCWLEGNAYSLQHESIKHGVIYEDPANADRHAPG